MIITRIMGGLGNQMFQYAIAKSLAKQRGDKLKLDISFYSKQTLRQYELDRYDIVQKFADHKEIKQLSGDSFISAIKRKLKLKERRPKSYFQENAFGQYHEELFQTNGDLYLDGYWQNEKYFIDIKSDLTKDFTPLSPMGESVKKYLERIIGSMSVSLHIRRGDYITNKHTNSVHGVCDMAYYNKAIKIINNNVDNPTFFIFSDDIEWCKLNFDFLKMKQFIEKTSAIDDLELMKHCKHNIIANSTFSWWGAWLNASKDKIVITPNQWFSDNKMQEQSQNIISPNWIRI